MRAGRKQREREFHNRAFSEHTRKGLAGFYQLGEGHNRFYSNLLGERARGRHVLEYGCGPGTYAFSLARNGAMVTGIDISEIAIAQAKERARNERVTENTSFEVMDAEDLRFSDHSFDLVCGRSIIHHLDSDQAFREISRVLRPEGEAIFLEPLGYNPLVNLFRKLTPNLRTADEHPLVRQDFKNALRYFRSIRVHYFDLLTLLAIPFLALPLSRFLVRFLQRADRFLFKLLPFSGQWAWVAVFELSDPK